MNNINTIINDIQDLRGKEITIFGTKTLIGEPSPYVIDVFYFSVLDIETQRLQKVKLPVQGHTVCKL